jgi:large subunit ribosomal protein L19e
MNLANKKQLAAKTLKVGKKRIIFDSLRLDEIKEAITKQDIKDLKESKAITIKELAGRKTNVKRKHRRGAGKVKIKVNTRKQDYVKMTRKLRDYIKKLKEQGKIDVEKYRELRNQIRGRVFKSKKKLRESLEQ